MPEGTRIETLLRQSTRFRALHHVPSCASTQDLAAERPCDDGGRFVDAVFWADHQTRGRGRQQRAWHDEPGQDLAVTFRVRAPLPVPLALPAAVPVAVAFACEPLLGRPLRVKWPNDLLLDGRKLAGVLIDAGALGPHTWLVGIGVNCNRRGFPPELAPLATSLALATGREHDRGQLLLAIARQFDAALRDLEAGQLGALEAAFRQRLGLVGARVRIEATPPQEGLLTHVDFGALVLDGRRAVPLGAVRGLRGL